MTAHCLSAYGESHSIACNCQTNPSLGLEWVPNTTNGGAIHE